MREEGRMEGKGENGLVEGSSDCEDDRAKLRPADIDADVREMERRKRVEAMMSSRLFREELERIVEAQMKDGTAAVGPLLQQIQDMIQTGPARAHNSYSVKSTNCVIPINDIRGVESMGYGKGEKMLRCKLAAVYRLMDLYGWTQGISNHITGRLNQEEELLLVNAYGMLYHEVTASSLVKVDMQGNIVEPGTTNYGVNVQGFHLHAAIHQARPDIKCIIHVHTPSVLAVSSLKVGLLPLSNESVVIGEVSSHQSTGPIQEPEEKDKLARNLGPINKVMLLSNNGAVCCGETVEEAFFNVYNTVLACESQMKVMPLGVDNLVLMQDETRKAIYDSAHRVPESTALPSTTGQPTENKEKRWRIGGLHFEALMRMLDNAGFRTGYLYRTPLIKGEPPKPRSDVEVPPAVSSLGYLLEEEEMYRNWKKMGATKNDRTRWLNSPNVYQKVEILETGTPDPKKITKWVDANAEEWVADGSPTHSSTPVKIADALQFVPKNTNPKEFKKLQQQIKENRRADKITSGPQSHILEGVTWEEAKKLQDANMTGISDQVVLVGAASKGIIQREFQHNATVYKTPYAKNPFDSVSAQEIEDYKRTVTRKQRGESYDEEQSESEALSSSAALPPSGFKSPPSETDDDSRTEARVLRIETKTAPIPSQAEYVLSDDDVFIPSPEETKKALVIVKAQEINLNANNRKNKPPGVNNVSKDDPRKLGINETVRCYARVCYTASPPSKESPVIFQLSSAQIYSKPTEHKKEYNCTICRRRSEKNAHVSSRSTQTVISFDSSVEENLTSRPAKSEKPPVVRKLAMDAVIDELKNKFSVDPCAESFDVVDLDEGSADRNCEDVESCTIYPIPKIPGGLVTATGNDFTSEETATRTSSWLTDDSLQPKDDLCSAVESYIGEVFEGGEAMFENPLSPRAHSSSKLDSYALSDLLSNVHVYDDDNNATVSYHSNLTRRALLISNDSVQQTTAVCVKKSDFYVNSIGEVDFIDTAHSTSCEESKITEIDTSPSEIFNRGLESEVKNFGPKKPEYTVPCGTDDRTENRNNFLVIDGKDFYHFYKEFDPSEVFQMDSENISMQANYDDESLEGSATEDGVFTSVSEHEVFITADSDDPPVLVDENIVAGKKYLLTQYLSKNESDKIHSELTVENYDFNICVESENETEHKGVDICCGLSEDSAVFSGLTLKTNDAKANYSSVIDANKVIDWSLSDNSKEGHSINSCGSSGIRLSFASEDEMPKRPTLSSVDEFLIKETICNNFPFDQDSTCNSHNSFPLADNNLSSSCLKFSRSLPDIFLNDTYSMNNFRNYLKFNTYKMPNLSTIFSYYTLVSGFEKNSSMPDLSSKEKKNISPSPKDSNSYVFNNNYMESEFDERGVYISDEFICRDSECEINDGGDILYFLKDRNDSCRSDAGQKNLAEKPCSLAVADFESDDAFCSDDCENKVLNETFSNEGNELNKDFVKQSKLQEVESGQRHNISPLTDKGRAIENVQDCIRCFVVSSDESLPSIFCNENNKNKIIQALKKKFKKHKCGDPKSLRCPLKFNTKKSFDVSCKGSNCFDSSKQLDPLFFAKGVFKKTSFAKTNPSDLSTLFFNSDSGALNCIPNFNYSDKFVREQKEENCSGYICPNTTRIEKYERDMSFTYSKGPCKTGAKTLFSSAATCPMALEAETFYSFGNDPCLRNTDPSSSSQVTKSAGYLNMELETNSTETQRRASFIVDGNARDIYESLEVPPADETDDSLLENSTNLLSVSCQTDESFQDDQFFYHPTDYREVDSSSSWDDVAEYRSPSHSLYTIYETSCELGPDF